MKKIKEIKETIKEHIENYEYRASGIYLQNGGYATVKNMSINIEGDTYIVVAKIVIGNDMDGVHTTYDNCKYWITEDDSTPDKLKFLTEEEFEKKVGGNE